MSAPSFRAFLADLPAETLDGHHVSVQANIESAEDIAEALRRGAEGVGLYRTEFLYLTMQREPTEDDHYQAYAVALGQGGGVPWMTPNECRAQEGLKPLPDGDKLPGNLPEPLPPVVAPDAPTGPTAASDDAVPVLA